MAVENQYKEEINKLRLQNERCGGLIKLMDEKIGLMRKELGEKDKLIASLTADIETFEKANLLLENNIKIKNQCNK